MMDDIDRIMEVMEAAFEPRWGEAWNRRQISSSLALPHTDYTLVGEKGGTPEDGKPAAGFTLIKIAPGEEELLLIAVRPEHRGRGLGKRLLDIFANQARKRGAERIFLEMRANNPARALYEAHGFEPIGTRKNYYSMDSGDKIDAITFALTL